MLSTKEEQVGRNNLYQDKHIFPVGVFLLVLFFLPVIICSVRNWGRKMKDGKETIPRSALGMQV